MKTVLVLGAGGFIGKSLCKELSKSNYVKAFDVSEVEELQNNEYIEIIVGNFVTIEDFSDILAGVNIVYHLISTTLPNDDTKIIPLEIEQNIIPTVKLLECMMQKDVKDIVFASSAGTIYGETGDHENCVTDSLNPICSYGVQKKVIESYLQFYGERHALNYKIARLSNPYGLGQNPNKPQGVIPIFINRILKGEDIIIYGDGTSERDYIYLDDLVEGLTKVGEYDGDEHIFNLGFGQVHSLLDIIQIIENLSGRKFKNIIYEPKRFHDVTKTVLEVKSTQKLLSWVPKVKMELGIKIILDRMKKNMS